MSSHSLRRPWPSRSALPGSSLFRSGSAARWWLLHLWLPLLAAALLSFWLFGFDGDLWLADRLYALEGRQWAWKNTWLAAHLLHDGSKRLSALLWSCALAGWLLAAFAKPHWQAWRWPLAYLLLAVLFSTSAVALMKVHTNMDCPWDLLRYGGTRAYHGLFAHYGGPKGRCFPAGNASAGYAWLALYFFFLAAQPRLRWLGLGIGVAFGLVLGINQQFRGAHFLAHDVWTAAICWLISLGLYAWMLRGKPVQDGAHALGEPA